MQESTSKDDALTLAIDTVDDCLVAGEEKTWMMLC